jgi:hypothetical protein
MNKEQTAMQWFAEQLPIRIQNSYRDEIEKALQMERELLVEAYIKGAEMGQVIITQRLNDTLQQNESEQ